MILFLQSINIPLIRRKILDVLRGSVRIKRHLKTPPVPHFSRPSSSSEAKAEVRLFYLMTISQSHIGFRVGCITHIGIRQ